MRPADTGCSSDASIYWAIRQEDRKGKLLGDLALESHQHNLSSDHARRCIRALLRNETLKVAFDPVLSVPGLRDGMRISTLHKLCSAKCDEEAAAYLAHIIDIWFKIALQSKDAMAKITAEDIKALELRCPKFCPRDAAEIEKIINQGRIFRAFSQEELVAMKAEILSVDCVIPSLYTFFHDVHLLETCAASMKHIITPGNKTIRTALRDCFRPMGQRAEPEMEHDVALHFENAMESLWIFVLQNFQRMPRPSGRTYRKLLATYLVEKPHEETLLQFANFAQKLGFQTPEIEYLTQATVAHNNEHRTDPPSPTSSQQLPTGLLQSTALVDFLVARSSTGSAEKSAEEYVKALRRRCGRPKHESYQRDRAFLTKEILHFDFSLFNIQGPDIAPFFVLRSQYLAFFASSGVLSDYLSAYESSDTDAEVAEVAEAAEAVEAVEATEAAEAARPLNLGESIMRSRNYSEEAVSVLSLTTEDDEVVVHELAVENLVDTTPISEDQAQTVVPHSIYIMFKVFREGRFEEFKQADASNTTTVAETARGLMRDHKMKLFSTDLRPLMPEECLDSATVSGVNTIFLLPENEVKISDKLRKAISQLCQR